jgi:hypothetical protein
VLVSAQNKSEEVQEKEIKYHPILQKHLRSHHGSSGWTKASEIAQRPEVKTTRDSKAFNDHHRCEPNYALDSGALSLLKKARLQPILTRMKMCLAKAVLLPQQGMIDQVEQSYKGITGRCIWDDADLSPHPMLEALKPLTLDNAYGGMRRGFFKTEAKRQGAQPGPLDVPKESTYGGERTKTLFVNYWLHLIHAGAFEKALEKCVGDSTEVREILEETLLVGTGFHRMLVARELSVLVDTFPADAGTRMLNVGGGAAMIVREFAGKNFEGDKCYNQSELLGDLKNLHNVLVKELDMGLVDMICPRGWAIDFTEHAACEKRRYDAAVANIKAGKRPSRTRDEAGAAERQRLRCRRLRACWRTLGFKALPSRAVK